MSIPQRFRPTILGELPPGAGGSDFKADIMIEYSIPVGVLGREVHFEINGAGGAWIGPAG